MNDLIMMKAAATDTSRNATIIAFCHLIKNSKSREAVRGEIKACLEKQGLSNVLDLSCKLLSPTNFEYLNRVIDECLRFNHPAPITDQYAVVRDCKLGNFEFKKDSVTMVNFFWLHKNPNEWPRPDEFHAERFDPDHELFKTSDGKQRKPCSFLPFGTGERRCIGYMFAQAMMPSILTKVIANFDFEFEEKELYEEHKYPVATLSQNHQYPIPIKIKSI